MRNCTNHFILSAAILGFILMMNPSQTVAQSPGTLHEFTGAAVPLTRVFHIHPEDSLSLHPSNARELSHLLYPESWRASMHRQTLGRLGFEREPGDTRGLDYWLREFARPEVYLMPFTSGTQFNSDFAWGANNGPAWSGRGYTQSISGGFSARWLIFDVQLAPIWVNSQNRDFDTGRDVLTGDERSRYIEAFGYFDNPARMDSSAYDRWYWGETWAKVMLGPISAGVSNQNLWWGPGRRHSLLMTNNAPGFQHATLHTNRPLNIGIGGLQFQYVAARLERSYYNEAVYLDDWRFLTALVVDFEPRFAPGLHVGLVRAFHIRASDLDSRSDYFPLFQPFQKENLPQDTGSLGDGSLPDDQRASVYFSWHFPNSETTFYGEYGRTDHAADIRDFYLEPNHARAYMLGFHKVFRPEVVDHGSMWSLSAEIVDASNTSPSRVRLWRQGQTGADLRFYNHGSVRHGYTHRGRGLGSSVGLGSTGWFAALQRSNAGIDMGFMGEFIRGNRVAFLSMHDNIDQQSRQELSLTAGFYLQRSFVRRTVDVKTGIYRTNIRNQFYVGFRDDSDLSTIDGNGNIFEPILHFRDASNVHVQVSVVWRPYRGILTK